MLYPTGYMPAFRIVMGPVDDSTFFVPNILAVETDAVAYLKSVDARCNVDVVCQQQCLSRRKLNCESLVSQPVQIVWQNANHLALTFDLYVACPTRECATDGAVANARGLAPFSMTLITQDYALSIR